MPEGRDDRHEAASFREAECNVVWAPSDALVVHTARQTYRIPTLRNARPDITSQQMLDVRAKRPQSCRTYLSRFDFLLTSWLDADSCRFVQQFEIPHVLAPQINLPESRPRAGLLVSARLR